MLMDLAEAVPCVNDRPWHQGHQDFTVLTCLGTWLLKASPLDFLIHVDYLLSTNPKDGRWMTEGHWQFPFLSQIDQVLCAITKPGGQPSNRPHIL